jgi:hypothetical protein
MSDDPEFQVAQQDNSRARKRVWIAIIGAVVFGGLTMLGSAIATWARIPVWMYLFSRGDVGGGPSGSLTER